MKKELRLFHGSQEIVSNPRYGYGNIHNDYGQGFYCTEYPDIGREWACKDSEDGFLNEYVFHTSGLRILYLNSEYSVLNWLAVLLNNRPVTHTVGTIGDAVDYLRRNYLVDISGYDVIVGYRVDDRYFSFVRRFLSNDIGLDVLTKCMNLGKLGEQIVLKSERAFDRLEFCGSSEVDSSIYYQKYRKRMKDAVNGYEFEYTHSDKLNDKYIIDFMREEMK